MEIEHLPPLDHGTDFGPTERSGARDAFAPRKAMGDNVTIQKNWQELIRPGKLQVSAGADPRRVATVVAEPLERGFGVTLGNSLRRVLLSSLQGAAVTAVQIDGVVHEFSSMQGVREDVVDIVLNIKQLALRMHAEGPKRMTLRATGPGEVTAGQIDAPSDIEILNPSHVICTLDEGATVRMEFTVQNGKGYVSSEFNRPEDAPIGLIAVDALYSPVKRVAYRVEPTRQGQSLDYDKLVLEVETNGAVSPVDAVAYASRILQDQLQIFITFDEPKKKVDGESKPELPQVLERDQGSAGRDEPASGHGSTQLAAREHRGPGQEVRRPDLIRRLNRPIGRWPGLSRRDAHAPRYRAPQIEPHACASHRHVRQHGREPDQA
jgi:DNA-directed RNA polymerase subunit alpha